jgi:hypothetical protein
MDILHLLGKELHGEDILCLDVLPDAVLVACIPALPVKEIEQVGPLIFSQLHENSVCREGPELLQYSAD